MNRLVVENASHILSGSLTEPVLDGDSIYIENGTIKEIGFKHDFNGYEVDTYLDVDQCVVSPGLIDTHSHPVIGDWSPRQDVRGWASRALHGGVTDLISAGETHWPGRTKDGPEAASIAAAAFFTSRLRPRGQAAIHGGALLLDKGIRERDLDALHELGVRKLGEVGLGSEKDISVVEALAAHAKRLGWVVPLHFGGASVPGSSVVGLDYALQIRPTVISHANGGPTARPMHEVLRVVEELDAAIEVVFAGNASRAQEIVRVLSELGALERLQFGTDTPSGTGSVPLGMLRVITECSCAAEVAPEVLIACASGIAAERYGLHDRGIIERGRLGNLVVLDAPRGGEAKDALSSMRLGNVPAVAAVVVNGSIEVSASNTTPPPISRISITSSRSTQSA